jgi:hypothetical protein
MRIVISSWTKGDTMREKRLIVFRTIPEEIAIEHNMAADWWADFIEGEQPSESVLANLIISENNFETIMSFATEQFTKNTVGCLICDVEETVWETLFTPSAPPLLEQVFPPESKDLLELVDSYLVINNERDLSHKAKYELLKRRMEIIRDVVLFNSSYEKPEFGSSGDKCTRLFRRNALAKHLEVERELLLNDLENDYPDEFFLDTQGYEVVTRREALCNAYERDGEGAPIEMYIEECVQEDAVGYYDKIFGTEYYVREL